MKALGRIALLVLKMLVAWWLGNFLWMPFMLFFPYRGESRDSQKVAIIGSHFLFIVLAIGVGVWFVASKRREVFGVFLFSGAMGCLYSFFYLAGSGFYLRP
jgi:uncharacterized metal-binding protein